jgi:hypothetical protein
MEDSSRSSAMRSALPIILIAAVAQGWALFGLHHAIKNGQWPATDQRWLFAFYTLAVFVPITIQLLVEHARRAALWVAVAVVAAAFFYFGWHYGATADDAPANQFATAGNCLPQALILTVLWLLLLPFAQNRLQTGAWRIQYELLFSFAWRNKLLLGEATLFTGLFWLLLALWQMLFHMLGIDYFRDLFEEPIFVYPVTSLTFGCALHLIGSVERFTSVVLEQLLNVLKWLALVAGLILVLFTIALVFKLPGLVFTGQRAIGAGWLLWLVAVMVLLLNAAYRDGNEREPYPTWIAQALRFAVPLTVVVAATALYALVVRTHLYGLTTERYWAFVVAAAALIYSVGYAVATIGKGFWLAGIARVNVIAALALIVVISAALTPLLSPYRLAADSQFRIIKERPIGSIIGKNEWNNPFHYLRFDTGRYGMRRLRELAQLRNHPEEARIRQLASAAIAQKTKWSFIPAPKFEGIVAKLAVYPAGRTLDPELARALIADSRDSTKSYLFLAPSDGENAGIYIDLNGDGIDEFVWLKSASSGLAYEKHDGQWRILGPLYSSESPGSWRNVAAALARNDFKATTPLWKLLSVGDRSFALTRFAPAGPATAAAE